MKKSIFLMSCAMVVLNHSAAIAAPKAKVEGPDVQAAKIVGQMTPEDKLNLVHGIFPVPMFPGTVIPAGVTPSAGYVTGVPRLAVPALRETDASLGVAYVFGLRGDGATALPSSPALAASWNPDLAYQSGAMIGQEAWRSGFNVLLAGGANLARDARNGRNFEYLGEDPLLAGTMAGESVRGIQSQHVISTVKHFAINDLETGRQFLNAKISESGLRESDLLAFEIAIKRGEPGSVMCSYNLVNGAYACGNDFLLNKVLKRDWGFKGWVMSDWGAVHGLSDALNGLDQQSGQQLDKAVYFHLPLQEAVKTDKAYATRLDDMNQRILRSMIAVGVIEHPPVKTPLDREAGAKVAQTTAAQGMVLLRNQNNLLPLTASAKRIVVIGGHADLGVLSGAGSSQVAPREGPSVTDVMGGEGALSFIRRAMYMPSSPLKAIRAGAPQAKVTFDDGRYPAAAAELAKNADVAIVFATQWMMEAYDSPDLSLPSGQDELIAAVAAANPNTIVVLETGGPVTMPWLDQVGAVVEAWYPGIRGGEAIADLLLGKVAPSGRLPITFPASMAQTPHPILPGINVPEGQQFDVDYAEGSDVGYRWFAKTAAKPLFPFGYGLTYTQFAYSDLVIKSGAKPSVSFTVKNTGAKAGTDVPQLYLTASPNRTQQRLVGWSRVELAAGETKSVTVPVDPKMLANWDQTAGAWRVDAGTYQIAVGASASDLALKGTLVSKLLKLKPQS
jgi:beta-glucosidase